jgi:hypothetical protein
MPRWSLCLECRGVYQRPLVIKRTSALMLTKAQPRSRLSSWDCEGGGACANVICRSRVPWPEARSAACAPGSRCVGSAARWTCMSARRGRWPAVWRRHGDAGRSPTPSAAAWRGLVGRGVALGKRSLRGFLPLHAHTGRGGRAFRRNHAPTRGPVESSCGRLKLYLLSHGFGVIQ